MKSIGDAVKSAESACFSCKTLNDMSLIRRPTAGVWNGKRRTTIVIVCNNCAYEVVRGIPEDSVNSIITHTGLQLKNVTGEEWEQLEQKYSKFCEDRQARYREEMDQAYQERHREYERYLLTPQWAAKRAMVLQRDNHLCQGCLKSRAVSAHHLTYDRLFNEPLFDLISVCKACHDQIHANKARM